jgi:hypothetical protein
MKLHGYHSVSEIAEVLSVSEPWLEEQLEDFMGNRQLTLYGEAHYMHTDVEVWVNRFPDCLRTEQKRMRALARECAPIVIDPNGPGADEAART